MPTGDVPDIDGFIDLVEIGRGGFSTVYSATQLGLRRPVAVKVINATGSEARRFEREALALGALTGIPNVVGTYQVARTNDGRPALVMELLVTSIADEIADWGPVRSEFVVRWANQIAAAIDRAHGVGIAHRDIKPQNVLLSGAGDAFLADFGIASLEVLAAATTTNMSISPPFAAPERFTGNEIQDRPSDIYSFAATLYSALAGVPPFGTTADGGPLGLMRRVTSDELPELPDEPAAAYAALGRAMAKDPSERHSTARELAAELAAAYADAATTAPSDAQSASTTWSPLDPTVRRDEIEKALRPSSGSELDDGTNAPAEHSPCRGSQPARKRRRIAPLLLLGVFACMVGVVAIVVLGSSDDDGAKNSSAATRAPTGSNQTTRVVAIDTGWKHSCAVLDGGRVACWGLEGAGELGDGTQTHSTSPRMIDGIDDAVSISAGYATNACAVLGSGGVKCWGSNGSGQLGDGTRTGSLTPVAVTGVSDAVAVNVGSWNACALLRGGTVKCWGSNSDGALGDGTTADSAVPVEVVGLADAVAIAQGEAKTNCAILADATAKCWGANDAGQLADGAEMNPEALGESSDGLSLTPIAVAAGVRSMGSGNFSSCASLLTGGVSCWGTTTFEDSGSGTKPAVVDGIKSATTVVGGDNPYTAYCALTESRDVLCWGSNDTGQLGSTGAPESKKPRRVGGASGATMISGNGQTFCALLRQGNVRCWGLNQFGSLGNGSTKDSAEPVDVAF